ncbi:hypothetical protein VNI00_001834 [Paramarasmius palmivorus]|uniref:Rad51-like C-terminal domain-containing protein n=1 Tax=Paramarasmius palmivorus TaxID=297713 RepID=A0AAW0E2T1_9AGAR
MPPRREQSQVPAPQAPAPRSQSPTVDEDDTPWFDSVDELQQHGINVQDILKLKSAAINTVSGVNMTTRRQMLKIKGMSEAKVEKIKGSSFSTGVEVQDKRKKVLTISTGSKSVDGILGGANPLSSSTLKLDGLTRSPGGVMSQSITEGKSPKTAGNRTSSQWQSVYGEFRTGKTQLAHTMSVVAQLPPDLGGASGKMELINECSQRFAEDKDFRLLVRFPAPLAFAFIYFPKIVDSIMALFRVDFSGRGELGERQQKVCVIS